MGTCERSRLRLSAAFIALALVLVAGASAAQTASQSDSASALALFEEARALVKADDYASACPKFEAAAKLHPTPGVLLNLADCYEHTHRTASAWVEFEEAATTAAHLGLARAQAEASRRKALLEPRLRRLLVHVEGGEGFTIRRDGDVVERAAWGTPVPVDPGEHRIVVDAPGRVTWSTTVTANEEGRIVVVDVPELPPAAGQAGGNPTPTLAEREAPLGFRWTPWRIGSAASMGVGAVTMIAGGGLLLAAKGLDDQAKGETGRAQYDDSTRAVSQANVASGLIIGGGVVALAGFVIWMIQPKETVTHAQP
jgi:hypothetical protein